MVIKKKNIDLEKNRFIKRGGSVNSENDKWTNICLRIPKEMVIDIDMIIEQSIGITRTGWILRTLQEKLRKDQE